MKFLKKLLRILPDKLYIQLQYFYHFYRFANLKNPQTFNEKLQWLKLYDRNPLYTTMVDKYKVKEYVANIIGKEYIIPTLAVYNSSEEIDFDKLPNQFVLKCNHDSGGIVICKDKSKLDKQAAIKKLSKALKNNGYWYGREWPYKNVKPYIIAEQYLEDESNNELKDYKIFCFNGVPKYIQLDFGRFSKHYRNYYDISWNFIPFNTGKLVSDSSKFLKKPQMLDKALNLANILSSKISFVRVDFYLINEKIYFGELTFYPASGFKNFTPFEWDKKFGDLLILPSKENICF